MIYYILYGVYGLLVIEYLINKKSLFEKVFKVTPEKYVKKSILEALFFSILIGILPYLYFIDSTLDSIIEKSISWQELGFFTIFILILFIFSFLAMIVINKNKTHTEKLITKLDQLHNIENYNKAKKSILKGYIIPIIFLIISLLIITNLARKSDGISEAAVYIMFICLFGLGIIFLILSIIFISINIKKHLEFKRLVNKIKEQMNQTKQ